MWRFLALGIRAMTAVLSERGRFSHAAVIHDREYGDAASGIVGDKNVFSSFVEADVAGIAAPGCDLIQQGQFAGRAVDGEGAHRATFLALIITDFIHRI